MAFFAATEYIKYLLKAKGRHGTHSPFVYNLVDKGLKGKVPLRDKLTAYFGAESLVYMGSDSTQWQSFFDNRKSGTILVAQCIHRAEENAQSWNQLAADKAVKMSIDLFALGLLFFNDEFKEKQHFILKQNT
jgi:hypothetical protein